MRCVRRSKQKKKKADRESEANDVLASDGGEQQKAERMWEGVFSTVVFEYGTTHDTGNILLSRCANSGLGMI